MGRIEWDPSLELGHPDIDGQHQEIFRRYGALVEAMEAGVHLDLSELFDFLGGYVAEHFAAEERVMAETAYPGVSVHAAAHTRFVREYGELRALWQANGRSSGVAVKARTWIGDWLRAHISGVDLALARYLAAGGSSEKARVESGALGRDRGDRRAAPGALPAGGGPPRGAAPG